MTSLAAAPLSQRAPNPQAVQVLAQEFRGQQALAAAVFMRSVIMAWRQIETGAIKASWAPARALIETLLLDSFNAFWAEGLRFYGRSRWLAAAPGQPPVLPAVPAALSLSLVGATLDTTGPGAMLHAIRGGQSIPQARETAAVKLAGATARLALSGARTAVMQSVAADQQAIGWARITADRPCAFCAMLASRGPVYKTEQSASFEAHNHCMCVAAPVFSRSEFKYMTWPDIRQQWNQVTKGLSGADARRAWRRHWDSQN